MLDPSHPRCLASQTIRVFWRTFSRPPGVQSWICKGTIPAPNYFLPLRCLLNKRLNDIVKKKNCLKIALLEDTINDGKIGTWALAFFAGIYSWLLPADLETNAVCVSETSLKKWKVRADKFLYPRAVLPDHLSSFERVYCAQRGYILKAQTFTEFVRKLLKYCVSILLRV